MVIFFVKRHHKFSLYQLGKGRLQYYMRIQLNIIDGLVRTICHAPAEYWCTEMEQISSPFKRFTATQNPLVAGATNKPVEWHARSILF